MRNNPELQAKMNAYYLRKKIGPTSAPETGSTSGSSGSTSSGSRSSGSRPNMLGRYAGPVTADRDLRAQRVAEKLAAENEAEKEARNISEFKKLLVGQREEKRKLQELDEKNKQDLYNQMAFTYDRHTDALAVLEKNKKEGVLLGGRKKSTKRRGKKSKKTRRNKRNK